MRIINYMDAGTLSLHDYEAICLTRQNYEVEQLPTPSFMKHGE